MDEYKHFEPNEIRNIDLITWFNNGWYYPLFKCKLSFGPSCYNCPGALFDPYESGCGWFVDGINARAFNLTKHTIDHLYPAIF